MNESRMANIPWKRPPRFAWVTSRARPPTCTCRLTSAPVVTVVMVMARSPCTSGMPPGSCTASMPRLSV